MKTESTNDMKWLKKSQTEMILKMKNLISQIKKKIQCKVSLTEWIV